MAVYIDVKSRFDDTSGRKAAEEAKRYFDNAGTSSGDGFMGNFARAVEKDTKVRAAAEKVSNSLDKITAAEAKKATQLEKSKAITEAVTKAESDLTKLRQIDHVRATEEVMRIEKQLVDLKAKQIDSDNKLVASSAAVSTAQRAKAAATREASQAYRDMGKDVDGLGTKLANLGSVGGALKLNLGLAALGTLPAAATAITEVAGALQQLAGAGFAVPGIFAGIAASVGVGALGMYGMTDAIKAVDKASDGTKASVEAANAALAKLPASSAEVVKTVVGLKGTFTDLSTVASTNMFAGFSAGLKGLVAADLPAVTRGVDGISRGINQNLLQATRSLGSSSSQGILDRIFGNTATAQSKLTAAIDPAISAIGTLTAAGTDSLPRLADAIGDVADRFNRFITTADANGSLKKWIDEGLDGFTQLGNTALNIGHSFTALTEAAGGGAGLLGTLESATGKMSAFLNSTEGQTKLKDFFAEGRDMLGQLKDVATSAGPVLGGVFRAGVDAANLWLPVIKDVLDTINKIPGGAAAVVGAFAAWKTITGVAALASSLGNIAKLLEIGLPGAAATGATGISAAFAAIKLPAWLSSFLAAGGSIAALPAVADSFALAGSSYYESHHPGATNENAAGRGRAGIARRLANDGQVDPNAVTAPGYGGGGGLFGPGAAPGYGASADPNWKPVLDSTAARPGTYRRRDGSIGTLPTPGVAGDPAGVSGYTAPAITKGSGSANGGVPYVDPSKYAMGDPLAGLPAAVAGADPTKIYDADSKVITAAHNVEQQRLANQVLEAKGNATQAEILAAKFDLQEKERALYDAQNADIQARTNQMKQSTSDLKDVFAPLDQGFGISGGIPGIVDNLTKMFGNIALAGAISQSPSLQAGAAQLAANGGVAPGLFNQQFFTGSGASSSGVPAGYASAGAGYPGDAALLANVPKGIGQYDNATKDLSRGLVDCASGVEDLVNIMDGKSTVGGSLWTGNASSVLPGMGFQRGMGGPGDFRVGYNDHHMQATLPGGTNVNYGSTPAIQAGGLDGGQGAFDPAFTDHWFRPAGGSYAPMGTGVPASTGLGGGGGGGTQSVFVVNMPAGGFIGGPGGFAPGAGDPAAALGPTPLGGGMGPDLVPPVGTGSPATPAAGGGSGWGIPGLPSMPAGAGGQGYGPGAPLPGMAGQGAGQPLGTGVTSPGGAGGGGGGGLGIPQGLMGGAMGAASALDLMMPGAGQAAQVGLKVADRTIKFAGESAGIIAQGALDTWLPASTPLAGNSWFSKLLGGLSGAKPAKPNNAGGQGGQPQQAPPMGSPASGNGAGPPPGPGNTYNTTVNSSASTIDGTARDWDFHTQASHMAPGN